MNRMAIPLFCLVLVACTAAPPATPDPIDALVRELNASHGLWINGLYPIIELPPDAKPNEVLDQAIQLVGFDQGHIQSYRIQEVREVQLNTGQMETFGAALIQTNLGPKIFVFKPEKENRWWTRFYDIPQENPG